MATGALKLSANGSVNQQEGNGAAIAYGDSSEVGCCCCQFYGLIPCPDQVGARSDLIVSSALAGALGGHVLLADDGHCYTVDVCVDDTTGLTTISSGHLAESCESCLGETTFVCTPDLTLDLTDAEVEALYPDVAFAFIGLLYCSCYVSGGDSTQYHDHTTNGVQRRLVAGALVRTATGHYRTYTYYSVNNPAFGLTGDNWVTGCTTFGTTGCPNCVDWEPYIDNVDYLEVNVEFTLKCDHNGDTGTDDWTWECESAALSAMITDCFDISGATGGPWSGAGGFIGLVNNIDTKSTSCNASDPDSTNQNPCGDGTIDFYGIAPGIP